MYFINKIVGYLRDASDWFYDIYLEVRGWVWPFYLIADFFYELCYLFYYLAGNFSDFGDWVDDIADQVADILSWSNIRSLIRSWLPDLEDAIEWWDRWWKWVGEEIDDWWRDKKHDVWGWIEEAEDWLKGLIGSVETALNTLKAAWDDFKGKIPTIVEIIQWWRNWLGNVFAALIRWGFATLLDVAGLITTAFIERESWWAGWQDFRDKVVEFFTDPLEFLWTLFADWFLGPEE